MNLKLHLLIRMTLLGLLCWLGVSLYVVAQSGRRTARDMTAIADQLQSLLEQDVQRRLVSVDSNARYPALGLIAERFADPLCLRYRAADGSTSEQGCSRPPELPDVPSWLAPLLAWLGPAQAPLHRDIALWSRPVGQVEIVPDRARLLQRQWSSVRELLELTAVTLLALDLLAFWVVGRALRPTGRIVAALERIGQGGASERLPPFQPREFGLIAGGINRLTERLAQASAERDALTGQLIRLQEDERRELAHELHEEFGQCVAALGAFGASLRHGVAAGETLHEADLAPLEATVERMLASLRGMLKRMTVPPLAQQGLVSALQDLVTAWRARLERADIVLEVQPPQAQPPADERALCAYRIVQECLSNVARHAPASRAIRIELRLQPELLLVRVRNDRATAPAAHSGAGMGLKLLGERVRALRGRFTVEQRPQEFVVQAELPAPAA